MPNWCENQIEISGEETLLQKFNEENTRAEKENVSPTLSFELSLPTPAELLEIDGAGKYGWYEWRVANWGTKWNVSNAEPHFQNGNLYYFPSTAWAPPSAWVKAVSALYPQLTFNLFYDEPGMCFAGKEVYINGELQSDISWEGETQIFASCSIESCEEEIYDEGASASERENGKMKKFYCENHKLEEAVIQIAEQEG
jgi:hypothetical protein